MATELEHREAIARALSGWSNDRPWDTRHPKNQQHWLLVAEALMSDDPSIVEPVNAYVRARKAKPSCERPPHGWVCTREHGHEGPCAALPALAETRQTEDR